MDELSGRLVANVGIDPAVADKAVDIVLDFLAKEDPSDKLQSLLVKLPDADALRHEDTGGAIGARVGMVGAGLSMGNVQSDIWKFIAYASEKVGGDGVGEFVAVIAARARFV
jgi:hypothetical protein